MDALALADGLTDALGLTLAEGETDRETEADGLALRDALDEGETEAEGLTGTAMTSIEAQT